MVYKIYIKTIGCKANYSDSERLERFFEEDGFQVVPYGMDADLVIVNSCVVTERAEADSRRALKRGKRDNPSATTVLTGCGAAMKGVKGLTGVSDKMMLMDPQHIRDMVKEHAMSFPKKMGTKEVSLKETRARRYVKIQNGCNNRCAYCIVPMVRGDSRSRQPADILDEVRNVEAMGCPEIVITGTHIGQYGSDTVGKPALSNLMKSMLEATDRLRFRLSSIEFDEIDEELLEMIFEEKRICNHIHMPLQSGDDMILRKMKRWYETASFLQFAQRVKERAQHISIGTDIITGFPGEGDREFENSYRFLENSPIDYAHVFTYSPRKGTRAFDMNGQIKNQVKRERTSLLRALSARKWNTFLDRFIGTDLEVVLEGEGSSSGERRGTSDNYIKVKIHGRCNLAPGDLERVRIEGRDGDKAIAVCI